MKRSFLVLVFALVATTSVVAQLENNPKSADKKPKVDWSKTNVYKRAADHFMFQFGYAGWSGHGDTMNIGGFSRTANVYLMFDFPFKSNPHFSAAVGAGVGSDNIFFKKTTIDIKHQSGILFTADTLTKYKKYKLNTSFFEIPVELRWSARPDNMNKGFKAALGMKLGILYDAKTKAKVDRDVDGNAGYWLKEKSQRSFQGTRLALIGRVGYGNFTAFGSYTITELFKVGLGPQGVRPWTVGVTFSGL